MKNKRKLAFQPPFWKKLRKLQIRPTAVGMAPNFSHRSRSSKIFVEKFLIDFVYLGGNSITELSLLRVYDIPTDKLQVKQACVHQQN